MTMGRPKKDSMTMEEAVSADAERQQEEAAATMESANDHKFRTHLAGLGGHQMAGDLTKAILEITDQGMKRAGQKRGWKGLPEADQREIISRAEWAAKEMLRSAVSAVAANRFPALASVLKGVQIGEKGYKLVIETVVNDDDHRIALLNSVSRRMLVVLAEPDVFAQHDPIKPLPDQPALPVAESPLASSSDDDATGEPMH